MSSSSVGKKPDLQGPHQAAAALAQRGREMGRRQTDPGQAPHLLSVGERDGEKIENKETRQWGYGWWRREREGPLERHSFSIFVGAHPPAFMLRGGGSITC